MPKSVKKSHFKQFFDLKLTELSLNLHYATYYGIFSTFHYQIWILRKIPNKIPTAFFLRFSSQAQAHCLQEKTKNDFFRIKTHIHFTSINAKDTVLHCHIHCLCNSEMRIMV